MGRRQNLFLISFFLISFFLIRFFLIILASCPIALFNTLFNATDSEGFRSDGAPFFMVPCAVLGAVPAEHAFSGIPAFALKPAQPAGLWRCRLGGWRGTVGRIQGGGLFAVPPLLKLGAQALGEEGDHGAG